MQISAAIRLFSALPFRLSRFGADGRIITETQSLTLSVVDCDCAEGAPRADCPNMRRSYAVDYQGGEAIIARGLCFRATPVVALWDAVSPLLLGLRGFEHSLSFWGVPVAFTAAPLVYFALDVFAARDRCRAHIDSLERVGK